MRFIQRREVINGKTFDHSGNELYMRFADPSDGPYTVYPAVSYLSVPANTRFSSKHERKEKFAGSQEERSIMYVLFEGEDEFQWVKHSFKER